MLCSVSVRCVSSIAVVEALCQMSCSWHGIQPLVVVVHAAILGLGRDVYCNKRYGYMYMVNVARLDTRGKGGGVLGQILCCRQPLT